MELYFIIDGKTYKARKVHPHKVSISRKDLVWYDDNWYQLVFVEVMPSLNKEEVCDNKN